MISIDPPTSSGIHYRPAIPVTLALIAGILLGEGLPGFSPVFLCMLVAAAAAGIIALRRNRSACGSPLLAILAAGYLSMVPWASPDFGPDHIVHYLDSGRWQIQGRVLEPPVFRLGRTRTVLDVEALSRQGQSQPVHGQIRLTVMGETELALGDRVALDANIRPLRNFNNPGGFDYRRYMAFKGIHGSVWVRAEKLRIVGTRPLPAATRIVHGLRGKLGRLIDAAGGPDDKEAQAVLKALVYGDRSGISSELRERFNRAGVGHLLAISGLHVGIVATVAYRCLVCLFSFCTPLLWRGWTRQWAAAATLFIVLAYGILAGMSPSTQRAVIMVAVFLVALILGRTHDILNTLAVAALAILVLSPTALFSISFQLSFTAVLAIVIGLQRFDFSEGAEFSYGRRIGKKVAGFVLVSALAIAGTAPVVLHYFNQTSLVGLAANLLLVPLVGFVAVPLGLTSTVVALVFETAAIPAFGLCIQILRLAMEIVDSFSGLSFAAAKTVTPSLLEMAIYYLAGWSLLNLGKARFAPWVLAAALITAAGDGIYWSHQRFWHRDLKVTAIDVGQGGATLMELPGGTEILYDGGGFSDNNLFDMGRQVVAPLLWRRKIATVDTLILSHPDADHLNGLIFIARHFNVRELWFNGDANTTWGFKTLMAVCREKKISVRRMDADSLPVTIGAVILTVFNPPAGFVDALSATDQQDRNDGSLVIKAAFGQTAFLSTGDITAEAEFNMLRRTDGNLASTVLFAPHHGSKSSSTPGLIQAVHPQTVVISAGAGNRFGFPHPEVTDRYRAAGCRVYCTGRHGAISMQSDGRRVSVRPFRTIP
ncbi:DNA internalization-related competence protein ComEC/Rec2 [uncultured Desulfosarcina sp.]|uniref:DNA internalization-related competence protein ComEC/Rec2 n=1 Tax=uncultured Desulfosarcina sp. TaxID=218289 RepID=UPI0029C74176|nr:DNA internalization-related competence protein ComEC/Rec2 [uncultured Desulfosarcina sp.]